VFVGCMLAGALGLGIVVGLVGWWPNAAAPERAAAAGTTDKAEAANQPTGPKETKPADKPPEQPADKPAPPPPPRLEYLVVALPGSSDEATAQLNKLAA
jgi:hypothetical protein